MVWTGNRNCLPEMWENWSQQQIDGALASNVCLQFIYLLSARMSMNPLLSIPAYPSRVYQQPIEAPFFPPKERTASNLTTSPSMQTLFQQFQEPSNTHSTPNLHQPHRSLKHLPTQEMPPPTKNLKTEESEGASKNNRKKVSVKEDLNSSTTSLVRMTLHESQPGEHNPPVLKKVISNPLLLKKPEQLQKNPRNLGETNLRVTNSSNEGNTSIPAIKINMVKEEYEGDFETPVERETRAKKVADFIRRQELLDNLKCSNAISSQRESEDVDQSFNVDLSFSKPREKKLREKEVDLSLPSLHKNVSQTGNPKLNAPKKKLTLRDYLYLNMLNSKCRNPESPDNSKSALSMGRPQSTHSLPSRRKVQASNSEIISHLKKDILGDIELMQNNLKLLFSLFEGGRGDSEPDSQDIMRIFAVSRMVKQKMLTGNDEIVKFLKESHEAEAQLHLN